MLLRPRYLAFDSSHLIQWADAKVSSHAPRRAEAQRFEAWLAGSGQVLLLCLHHIEEMANHEVDAIAAQRLRFLASLPFVAWIGAQPDRAAGTVVTLFAEEVAAACGKPGATADQVRDLAKPRLIQAGSGAEMLGAEPEAWLQLRPVFAAQAAQTRKVVAFTRVNTVDIASKPMSELISGRLRRGQDLRRQLDLIGGAFAINIDRRGDRRIDDPAALSTAFMQDVERLAGPMPPTAAELVFRVLAAQGVGSEDVRPESTVGEVLELVLFRGQLRVAAEAAGAPYADAVRAVRPDQIPSWSINQALERHLPDLPERQGGELTDTHLACLAAYADLTLVDKRTLEGVRRLRQKDPHVAGLLGRVERLARYEDAPSLFVQ